jgi:hypothetical protein
VGPQIGKRLGFVAIALGALAGMSCDDSQAPKPRAPPPEIEVQLHAHFGRPGATLARALQSIDEKRDVQALLASVTQLDGALIGLADLLRPADLVVAKIGETSYRVASFSPAPNIASFVPKGYRYEATPAPARIVGDDGTTRCVVAHERMTCVAGKAPVEGLSGAVRKRIAKWSQDRTDAVVEIEGGYLRERVLPELQSSTSDVQRRLGMLLSRGGAFEASLSTPGGAAMSDLGTWLVDLDRLVLRMRVDSRRVGIEGRVEWAVKGSSAAMQRTMKLHGSSAMTKPLTHLPFGIHTAVTDASADPTKGEVGLALGRIGDAARGKPAGKVAWDAVLALTKTLGPGYAMGIGRRGEDSFVTELYRCREPEAAAAALRALRGAATAPAIDVKPAGGRQGITLGETEMLFAVGSGLLVIVSSDGLPRERLNGIVDVSEQGDEASGTPLGKLLGSHTFAAGVDLEMLQSGSDKAAQTVTFGYRTTEKAPRSLRGAFTIMGSTSAIPPLVELVRKDPPPPRRRDPDEDAAGDAR